MLTGVEVSKTFAGNAGSGTFRTGYPEKHSVSCFQVGMDYSPNILSKGELCVMNTKALVSRADALAQTPLTLPLLTRINKKDDWTFRGWYKTSSMASDEAQIRQMFQTKGGADAVPAAYKKMIASGEPQLLPACSNGTIELGRRRWLRARTYNCA